ncbi:MAG: 4Fe-4S binding protein, partial [Hyphomicrobiales bacterium]
MNSPEDDSLEVVESKTDKPVSLAVAEPETGTLRHEPPRQTLPDKLFEKRRAIFPQQVHGFYRNVKYVVMLITLGIYYVTPWIRWDRGPFAPDQAVLVDIANRRFYMFGIEIWPQEFYFVAGLLIMAGIGLFLVTSAVGRAWCGYTCPQTVWTDLFQHVDRLVDGDRNAQARLARAPWGPSKIARRALKWSIYLVISFWTGGAWIMYFADAPTLVRDFWSGNAAPVAYITVAILTFTTFLLGGFLREQFCIYMCPWPRIQSAMMDERSLTVTYKDWR